jgi:hypothetical protein
LTRQQHLISYILEELFPLPDEYVKHNNWKEKTRARAGGLSFEHLGLICETIEFIESPIITATVVSDKKVRFEGKQWALSPLTKYLKEKRDTASKSGAYQGARYWSHDGVRLLELMNSKEVE